MESISSSAPSKRAATSVRERVHKLARRQRQQRIARLAFRAALEGKISFDDAALHTGQAYGKLAKAPHIQREIAELYRQELHRFKQMQFCEIRDLGRELGRVRGRIKSIKIRPVAKLRPIAQARESHGNRRRSSAGRSSSTQDPGDPPPPKPRCRCGAKLYAEDGYLRCVEGHTLLQVGWRAKRREHDPDLNSILAAAGVLEHRRHDSTVRGWGRR